MIADGDEAGGLARGVVGSARTIAYALFVPAGVGLTSAFGSQLLASTLHVTIAPWALSWVPQLCSVLIGESGV
jgi:hypothetical protein